MSYRKEVKYIRQTHAASGAIANTTAEIIAFKWLLPMSPFEFHQKTGMSALGCNLVHNESILNAMLIEDTKAYLV